MLALVFTAIFISDAVAGSPRVVLPSGSVIHGLLDLSTPNPLNIYLGLPYAKPPIGNLRLMDPQPMDPYPEEVNATQFPPACYQCNFHPKKHEVGILSEDCLHLNIWTPMNSSNLPVLIFLHGGQFFTGATNLYANNPKYLVSRSSIIVVTISYRLGALGFLDLNLNGSSGNLGLHDQIMAMRWIKENIVHFGGDPDNISLYGTSAGSMSIAFHLSIPSNAGLFKNVFMQSGVSNSAFFYMWPDSREKAITHFFQALNCSRYSGDALKCLQSKSPKKIVAAETRILETFPFYPNFNGKLFPFTSIFDFNAENLEIVPANIMIGMTRDEGSYLIPNIHFLLSQLGNSSKLYTVETIVGHLGYSNNTEIRNITMEYLKDLPENSPLSYKKALKEFLEDLMLKCPIFYFANSLATKGGHVYFYYFTYQNRYNAENVMKSYLGAAHNEDQEYVLGLPQRNSLKYTPEEIKFSNLMMDMTARFSKYGEPTSDRHYYWPQYERSIETKPYEIDWKDQLLMELNANYTRLITFPEYDRCTELWSKFFYPHTEAVL